MPKIQRIVPRVREAFVSHLFELVVSAIVGAGLMTVWFFVSSSTAQDQAILAEVHELVRDRLRDMNIVENGTESSISYTDSVKISFSSDAIIVWGKYRPRKKIEDVPADQETSLFLAIVENGPKSWIGTLTGNQYPKIITAFLTFDGYSSDIEIKGQRSDDILKNGQKQIIFDIVQLYGDGRGISPVILQKTTGAWNPILLRDFSPEVKEAILNTDASKDIRYSRESIDFLFDDHKKGELSEQFSFAEDWKMNFNETEHKFQSLRNSSGYKFLEHPASGKVNLVVALSLFDSCVLCSHHVFAKAFSLGTVGAQIEWTGDKSWNGGHGFISTTPLDYKDINFEKIYNAGFVTNKDGTYFLGPYFTKEIQ